MTVQEAVEYEIKPAKALVLEITKLPKLTGSMTSKLYEYEDREFISTTSLPAIGDFLIVGVGKYATHMEANAFHKHYRKVG